MTVDLPPDFAPATAESLGRYAVQLLAFLSSAHVRSIFAYHPNYVVVHGPRPEWNESPDGWWDWAAAGPRRWELIVDALLSPCPSAHSDEGATSTLPASLRRLLSDAARLALPRTSGERKMDPLRDGNGRLPVGMKPKKAHEVRRMSAFVGDQVRASSVKTCRIVDVGAGQGYLSRALAGPPHNLHLLALDSSEIQTNGAKEQEAKAEKRRSKKKKESSVQDDLPAAEPSQPGSLSHVLLRVNPQSLDQAITEWTGASQPSSNEDNTAPANAVHLVALHACGGLTPNILRQVVTQCRRATDDPSLWLPTGMSAVGCCYHLIDQTSDFPMSQQVQSLNERYSLQLIAQHLHLAAQCPLHWRSTTEAWANTQMAVKKIIYRALLVRLSPPESESQPSEDGESAEKAPRLGRLHDNVYSSWSAFLDVAAPKMGIERESVRTVVGPEEGIGETNDPGELTAQARRLEVLHILRCALGPIVESLILIDRYLYLLENLPSEEWQVDLINLFDQSTGSARNVCLAARRR
ncbi:methyltransferase domain-containing protein [Auriculariales sp. MPI-PUGE-AT-0066]|nr:methyltransferase domain-containing protein [Auriculariales sp. MPI-PUGE-AT-0066]